MDVQDPEEQFEDESLSPKTEPSGEMESPQVDSARPEAPAEEPQSELPVEEELSAETPEVEPPAVLPAPVEEAAEETPQEDPLAPDETIPEPEIVTQTADEATVAQSKREYASSRSRGGESVQIEVPPEAAAEPAWYVIHCYSGYENKVRHNLEQRIETMGMKDKIFDVVIPTQEEIEVRDGKRRTVERHIFPGYVLVNMKLSEESWYVVRNTPGVTGFVGMGNMPTPLRPEEVSQIIKRMEAEAPTVKVTFKVGERVRIIDGPFNDFRGTVSEIDMERTKVRVMVSFFGRETPVELDFLQVEKA